VNGLKGWIVADMAAEEVKVVVVALMLPPAAKAVGAKFIVPPAARVTTGVTPAAAGGPVIVTVLPDAVAE